MVLDSVTRATGSTSTWTLDLIYYYGACFASALELLMLSHLQTLGKCCVSDANDETVAKHFIGKVAVITGLNQAIERSNVLFH